MSRQHNQLSAACDNLKHIVLVPETVSDSEGLIDKGELLKAHKLLTDPEPTPDDLLFQLHKTSEKNRETSCEFIFLLRFPKSLTCRLNNYGLLCSVLSL